MSEEKTTKKNEQTTEKAGSQVGAGQKKDGKDVRKSIPTRRGGMGSSSAGARKKRRGRGISAREGDEFEQKIIDIARVTRVMAGGKRMRFRACVAIGNKSGKVGVGIAKGADVTTAINKAVKQAKKDIINVQIINDTIVHELKHKFGAAKILLKPGRKGQGIIAGGVMRLILELAGIHNAVGKIQGTHNKVNNAKCLLEALRGLKKVEVEKSSFAKASEDKKGVESKK